MTEIKREFVHTIQPDRTKIIHAIKHYQANYICTVKQYQKSGFGYTCDFVDVYLNSVLEESIALDHALSNEELEKFLDAFIERLNNGENVVFCDPDEQKMNTVFIQADDNLSNLEGLLLQKMQKANFDLHYEKRCYYLVWDDKNSGRECQETFHISKKHHPLACLKMAHIMGKKLGVKFKILLSDNTTKVDSKLLAFAISEI